MRPFRKPGLAYSECKGIDVFTKIVIANRGEIACRIIDTAARLGIATVAVYSDADADSLHVKRADEAVHIGASAVTESYLVGERIIAAAKATGAQAIHPGYGFLSENPDFVDAVEAAGLVFIGPTASAIRAMGLKDAAKTLMSNAGVPVVPGYHGQNQDAAFLQQQADDIGYPVLIKARAGGGGKGMRLVHSSDEFRSALDSASREGANAFGDPAVLIEKYITTPRHIEVQVFGDTQGNVVHLYERDCSLQRRHQKVIEEAPAPGMTAEVRKVMTDAAVTAAKAINYQGAGTIEFIVDGSRGLRTDGFWFMEMNTRLQVEHPVTEAVTGFDLVEWQIRVAAGDPLPAMQSDISLNGHAFEARLYAEDPNNGFLPATGTIEHLQFGAARIDSGVTSGDEISPFYDPMIAKLTTHGTTRKQALIALQRALAQTHVAGLTTNAAFLHALASHEGFASGTLDTGLIERDIDQLLCIDPHPELPMALAAMALLKPVADQEPPGWRLWGKSSERVLLKLGDETITVRVEHGGAHQADVVLPGETLAINHIAFHDDVVEVNWQGHLLRLPCVVYPTRDGRCVSILNGGYTHRYFCPDPLMQADGSTSHADDVRAPMTGAVCAVLVGEGDEVKSGQQLLILEAMKMEHTLRSPRDGRIKAIDCVVGTQVSDGAILLHLEPVAELSDA